MGKLKNKVLILGEGPTEFYYINSLRDVFRGIAIKPDSPKHTSISYLDKSIKEGIDKGYRYIFCLIDMDTKQNTIENNKYIKLKQRYAKEINQPQKGILCSVKFFETHLCTELFFLYYFIYTSRNYDTQPPLIQALNKECHYEKNEVFFRKCKGLHTYFEKNGGSLDKAIYNAQRSIMEKELDGRDHTFSEIGNMLTMLRHILQTE